MRDDIHIKERLLAFIQKETDAKENAMIQKWLEKSEQNVNLFLKLKKLYEEDEHPNYLSESQLEEQWEKVKAQMEPDQRTPPKKFWIVGVAASIVALFAVAGIWLQQHKSYEQLPETIYQTNGGERKSVLLADGTSIWLNANSKLVVSNSFGISDRDVKLEGEAWFDVASNPNQPFGVSVGEVSIQVLGTQFNVNAYEWNPQIVTSLEEGEISYSDGKAPLIFLKPGEQVSYNKLEQSSSLKSFNSKDYAAWRSNKLLLKNAPLKIAIQEIENFYGIQLQSSQVIGDQDLINMTLDNESPKETIDLLNTITSNHFTMKNNSP
ncbi:FecR family protein [Algoriphagus resistens]|uniref:FecR family protein n=1 Tax=Algoriphagus resistens TaxID=1750590 RepID=UPI0007167934|nr:FecR domain-containing protein [Algoriphagus resistens]